MRSMTRSLLVVLCASAPLCGVADDDVVKPMTATPTVVAQPPSPTGIANPMLVPEPAWSPKPARPKAVPPPAAITRSASDADAGAAQVLFDSQATWALAGYNNDEIVYTIFVINHDPRIIRCAIELSGFYYENGEKHSISDRQTTTVFPEQRVAAGNWQGMDQKSGATYSVKCHAV